MKWEFLIARKMIKDCLIYENNLRFIYFQCLSYTTKYKQPHGLGQPYTRFRLEL